MKGDDRWLEVLGGWSEVVVAWVSAKLGFGGRI